MFLGAGTSCTCRLLSDRRDVRLAPALFTGLTAAASVRVPASCKLDLAYFGAFGVVGDVGSSRCAGFAGFLNEGQDALLPEEGTRLCVDTGSSTLEAVLAPL